jgi:lipoprotein-anchoring transpeptidase ErfK/SrfK
MEKMQRVVYRTAAVALAASSFLIGACTRSNDSAQNRAGSTTQATSAGSVATDTGALARGAGASGSATAQPAADMRIEVDVNAKQLHVFQGGKQVGTYPVAVGMSKWPTEKGQWTIKQVVWNPDWIPPKDEAWAEDRDPRESGDPKNPLGRAQLVYDLPRTIHGTNAPSSIGKAVSHGSIRMTNDAIVQLAKQVMEAAGAAKDESWFAQTQQNRKQKQVVDLPRPVPIRVY